MLGASETMLLGGESALAEQVADDLANRGLSVDRARAADADDVGEIAIGQHLAGGPRQVTRRVGKPRSRACSVDLNRS